MNEPDSIWSAMKAHSKEKFNASRAQNMATATANDDGGWTKHTPYHWSRMVAGHRLDYWPSRSKWQYQGKVKRGDVMLFIAARTKEN